MVTIHITRISPFLGFSTAKKVEILTLEAVEGLFSGNKCDVLRENSEVPEQ